MADDVAQRERIFAEIERRFRALDGVAEVDRMPSGEPASFEALHIFDGGQRPGESDASSARYDMAVTIQGYVEKGGGSVAHTALNWLYARAIATVMPEELGEHPLGGLAEVIEEGPMQVEVAKLADARRLTFIVDLFITFPTRRGDPAQPA